MHDAYDSNPLLGIGRTLSASLLAMIQITQKYIPIIVGLALFRWMLA